jgi:hypothetical protein
MGHRRVNWVTRSIASVEGLTRMAIALLHYVPLPPFPLGLP